MARTFVVLALASLALGAAACGDDYSSNSEGTPGGTSGGDIGGPAPDSTIPIDARPQAATSTTLGEILENERRDRQAREQKVLSDATALGPLLSDFWTRELASVYRGMSFDPPDQYRFYRGGGNPTCGGGSFPGNNNAYYCASDQDEYVAFDLDWFQNYLVKHPRGATTFLILAHEWGHAVQDTWLENGGNDTWQPPYTKELNADCLAGVFLKASIEDETIVEEAGDSEAIFSWLYEAGSEPSPWRAPGSHGTRDQRIAAFSAGLRRDTDYCRVNY